MKLANYPETAADQPLKRGWWTRSSWCRRTPVQTAPPASSPAESPGRPSPPAAACPPLSPASPRCHPSRKGAWACCSRHPQCPWARSWGSRKPRFCPWSAAPSLDAFRFPGMRVCCIDGCLVSDSSARALYEYIRGNGGRKVEPWRGRETRRETWSIVDGVGEAERRAATWHDKPHVELVKIVQAGCLLGRRLGLGLGVSWLVGVARCAAGRLGAGFGKGRWVADLDLDGQSRCATACR